MAISPGLHSFTLQRRADYDMPLVFKDGDNNAVDLTGYTVESQVWDVDRTTKYADFAVTYTDRSAGSVKLVLTDESNVYNIFCLLASICYKGCENTL